MRASSLWAGLAVAVSLGCSDLSAHPDLVQMTGVSPQVVEPGDMIQISGHGFPEGATARISFSGDVTRSGQVPKPGVEVVVRTHDTVKDTITLAVNEELETAFCGNGDAAAHAIFRGQINVAFAASKNTMAPVSGSLKGVTLEVLPRIRSVQSDNERRRLAQQALTFLGISLVDGGQADCCTVAATEGRALLAGIKPGDRLLDFDGIPVRSPLDLVPAGRNRTSSLSITHDDSEHPVVRTVDVQGFRWTVPSELAPTFAVMLLMLGFMLGFASPIRKWCLFVSSSLANRLKRHQSKVKGGLPVWHRSDLVQHLVTDVPLPEFAVLRVVQSTSVIALGGLCALLAIREELVSAELDLILWWLVSSCSLSLAALTVTISARKHRLSQCLWFAAQVALHQFPLLVLITVSVVPIGSAHLADVVREQGPWPQHWLFFRDPSFVVLALVTLGALVPVVASPAQSRKHAGTDVRLRSHHARTTLLRLGSFLTNQLYLWVQSILLAVLLFGGWAVPGAATANQLHQPFWMLLATAVLLTKAWLIAIGLSAARLWFGRPSYRQSATWFFKLGVPVGVVSGVLSCTWTWCIRHWSLPWADSVLRWVLLSLAATFVLAVALATLQRVRHGQRTSLGSHWL